MAVVTSHDFDCCTGRPSGDCRPLLTKGGQELTNQLPGLFPRDHSCCTKVLSDYKKVMLTVTFGRYNERINDRGQAWTYSLTVNIKITLKSDKRTELCKQ